MKMENTARPTCPFCHKRTLKFKGASSTKGHSRLKCTNCGRTQHYIPNNKRKEARIMDGGRITDGGIEA